MRGVKPVSSSHKFTSVFELERRALKIFINSLRNFREIIFTELIPYYYLRSKTKRGDKPSSF